MIKHIQQADFETEIKEGVVLVDFYADWCAPCRMLGTVLEELAAEMDEQVKFVKINVDNNTQLSVQQGVTNIPALLIFKDGEKQNTLVGFKTKEAIEEELACYL